MKDFKFFHGIIRHGLTVILEPELNYNLNLYDDIADALSDEIRQEVDREILRNLTRNYPLTSTGTITPLPLTGTVTTQGGYTLTTANTGTVDYTIASGTGNLNYLNHYINMIGGSRA